MLIKSADDKTRRIELLQDLQGSPQIDAYQRQWLRDELFRLRRGIEGERDAAHYIDSYFKDKPSFAVIHDLRISVDGDVAQIDHLLLGFGLHIYLLETKCFNGNLCINERGEFTVEYAGEKVYGIPSPIEQSRRHERVLARLLDRLEITGRLGLKPTFHHAVLLHPKATITRPPAAAFNTDDVIKADQIGTWHTRYVERNFGLSKTLAAMINWQRPETGMDLAGKICRQHRPPDLLALPDFMKPTAPVAPPASRPVARPAPVPPPPPVQAAQSATVAQAPAPSAAAEDLEPLRRKLICVTCRQKITFPEGKFCWNNEKRFGGFQYCREHQGDFR